MGKRTLRAIHFDLVARVLGAMIKAWIAIPDTESNLVNEVLAQLARDFADEFEIRSETFSREKFLKSCGLEDGK